MQNTSAIAVVAVVTLLGLGACGGGTGGSTDGGGGADVTADVAGCQATVPDTLACNPVCNAGCSDGSVCTYSTDAQSILCQSAGTVAEGEACGAGAGLCAAGACVNGTCRAFCVGDEHCVEGQTCTGTLLGVTGDTGVKTCAPIDTDCRPLVQDCPEGEACYRPAADGDWVCLPAGTGMAGNTCRAQEECGRGFACTFSAEDTETGVCRALCGLEYPGSAVGSCADLCTTGKVLTLSRTAGVGACIPLTVDCDLFAPACPRAGGCYYVGDTVSCHEPGPGAVGDICVQPLDCGAGLLCLEGSDSTRCRTMCALAEDGPAGARCADLCPEEFSTVEAGLGLGACGQVVQAGECDLFLQNCDPGEACYPTETEPECYSAGFKPEGGECNYANDCQEGLLCIGSDNRCHVMCSVDNSVDPKCSDCASGHSSPLAGQANLGVCTPPPDDCDLFAQDCREGLACYPDSTGVGSCLTAGGTAAGAACTSGNECVPGTVCADDKCLHLCDRAAPNCPAEVPNCAPVTGWEQLGVCTGGA